jgi:tRNA A37 N6-isopentenylltransferase MiaA
MHAKKAITTVSQKGQLPIITGGTGLYVTALLEGYQPGAGRYSTEKMPSGYDPLTMAPAVERAVLNSRSDERYQKIFDDLLAETNKLIDKGVSPEWLESIGLDYRYAAYFIVGKRNRELAIEEFQKESRAYIRRQLTWWRHHGPVTMVKNSEEATKIAEQFLRQSGK